MKWRPSLLILFSVGIIYVITGTAGADPWDNFVSAQQIFEAQTIRCNFTKGVSANWDGAGQGFGHWQESPNVLWRMYALPGGSDRLV